MGDATLSRRRFVAGLGAAGAAYVLAPQALAARVAGPRTPTLRGGEFAQGVLSGDPTPTGITLLANIADVGGRGTVELEVARDRGFRNVVARRLIPTSSAIGHSVKARVGGLDPHEEYYYRFATRDESSPVGRFRTALPPDSRQPVRFAFFSCQDYTFGYYNAHARIAREDVDFVVCLGDYIYAEAYWRRGQRGGVRTDPVGEATTLDDYRRKYDVYRTDPDLRRMHALHPMISIWDDHEVQNNYAGGAGPDGGLSPDERYSEARKRAAYKAYFENMPTLGLRERGGRNRLYRSFRFGRNVELIVIDQRQYRADQPCGDAQIGDPCPELPGPRQFLGRAQMRFLKSRLASSPARWKVVANEVMIMNTIYPGGRYIGFDAWQGYMAERNELLDFIRRERVQNVVFVTGDIHTIIAGDVRRDGTDREALATEFVGGSITSQGLGEGGGNILPGADPNNPRTPPEIRALLFDANPWVRDADTDHHGYGLVNATDRGFGCRLRRVRTIKRRSTAMLGDLSFTVRPGQPSLGPGPGAN